VLHLHAKEMVKRAEILHGELLLKSINGAPEQTI